MSQINVYLNLLEKWLFKKRSNREILKLLILFFIIESIYYATIYLIFLYDPYYNPTLKSGDISTNPIYIDILFYLLSFLYFSIREEIVFRLPIIIFLFSKIKFQYKLSIIFFISFVFALVHIKDLDGLISALVLQGFSGVLLSIFFIIAGANEKKYLKALFYVVCLHFLHNIFITAYPFYKTLVA